MDIQATNTVDYSKKPSSNVDSVVQSGSQNGLASAKSTETSGATLKSAVTENAEIDAQKADELLVSVNEKVKGLQSFLKFEKDEDTEKMVFSIKNSETGEVIRQIPSRDLLEVSKQISQYLDRVQQQAPGDRAETPIGLLTDQIV
ncbi:flagellar protein FlaG [Hydrogenovibrio sp. SC-1]|uniref:flagellar protein FlaG n=1 Tax=Hydrogenovibrio sp. SC-1 TaxID=2065820 RepID=UPI001303F67A|nr:flagellar protein FlaG [Hydrogenovibrio sp. SC-1]